MHIINVFNCVWLFKLKTSTLWLYCERYLISYSTTKWLLLKNQSFQCSLKPVVRNWKYIEYFQSAISDPIFVNKTTIFSSNRFCVFKYLKKKSSGIEHINFKFSFNVNQNKCQWDLVFGNSFPRHFAFIFRFENINSIVYIFNGTNDFRTFMHESMGNHHRKYYLNNMLIWSRSSIIRLWLYFDSDWLPK